jgi:hypothetical protein
MQWHFAFILMLLAMAMRASADEQKLRRHYQLMPTTSTEARFKLETGSASGTVTVQYDMYLVPDRIRIYQDGLLLFDTGLVSGAGQISISFGPGTNHSLELVVNEGESQQGTAWQASLMIAPAPPPG